jgi:hypothetical protein
MRRTTEKVANRLATESKALMLELRRVPEGDTSQALADACLLLRDATESVRKARILIEQRRPCPCKEGNCAP